jgi:hypothetical protein
MKLHHSLQTELDYLLPNDIVEYCRFDRFDFVLRLIGTPAGNRWPKVKIWVDGKLIAQHRVESNGFNFEYSEQLDMSLTSKTLEIEYTEKTNKDTIVDCNGNILENQSLTIVDLIVNSVDIIANNTMPIMGNYTMNLDLEKLVHYQAHGYNTEPTDNLDMYENGRWQLIFPIPVTTHIAKIKNEQDPHKKWPDTALLKDIITTITDIRKLEKQLKEQK